MGHQYALLLPPDDVMFHGCTWMVVHLEGVVYAISLDCSNHMSVVQHWNQDITVLSVPHFCHDLKDYCSVDECDGDLMRYCLCTCHKCLHPMTQITCAKENVGFFMDTSFV